MDYESPAKLISCCIASCLEKEEGIAWFLVKRVGCDVSRLFLIFLVWGLTAAPVWAAEGAHAPQCREGIYGTWYPYDSSVKRSFGTIKVEPGRLWTEKRGGWVDIISRRTDKGGVYFTPTNRSKALMGTMSGFYFAIFNPVRIDWYRHIPCAVDLVVCAEEPWIGVEIENKTGEYITDSYPIGEMYCGHWPFVPYERAEIID